MARGFVSVVQFTKLWDAYGTWEIEQIKLYLCFY